jgi:hypothetical protein
LFPQHRQSLPHTDQFISSGSQSNGSIPPITLRWPLIRGSPGQLNPSGDKESGTETGRGGTFPKQEKWSVHQEWSFAVQAAPPSCDGISRHRLVVHHSLLLSANNRCFSPSVSLLLPVHLGALVTSKFTLTWVFILYRPHQISESFESKLADVGNPLVTQLGWYLHWPSIGPGPLKQGDCDRQFVSLPPKGDHVTTLNSAHLALFNYPDWGFSMLFPAVESQISGYYMQRRGAASTLPT